MKIQYLKKAQKKIKRSVLTAYQKNDFSQMFSIQHLDNL